MSAIIPADDGRTHINVYSKGATLLGRLLSNFAHTPINLPRDGVFASIEGYWYWLPTRDDRLRKLVGFEAKQLGKMLRSKDEWAITPEFKVAIVEALRAKLVQSPGLLDMLRDSDAPLLHYYVYRLSGKEQIVDKTVEAYWMLQVFERARAKVELRSVGRG